MPAPIFDIRRTLFPKATYRGVELKRLKNLNKMESKKKKLVSRPPIVTFMGHVDHGKTSILDSIRKSNVAAGEFGEITQHIGAYMVSVDDKEIVFLDTPGHEAFTAMRRRGAKVTDLVVLVVAADDGVMPQTIEAIDHCREANVPILVAINKIDKTRENINKIKNALMKYNLTPEDMGGKTIYVETSAKTGEGLNGLLDMIILSSDMMELKDNPYQKAEGSVIESKVSKNEGVGISLILSQGTLKPGDPFVVGLSFGKVKRIIDERGNFLEEVLPARPVRVLGANSAPEPGELFLVVGSEKEARVIAGKRKEELRQVSLKGDGRLRLEDLYKEIKEGKRKELKIIIKGDVAGSAEALRDSLIKLSDENVEVKVIHSVAGKVNESDVMLALASQALIIGFNVSIDNEISNLAKKEKVTIKTYLIIYEAIDEIKRVLQGLVEPEEKEIDVGKATVRRIFTLSNGKIIAGSFVNEGKMTRGLNLRVMREGKPIYEGKMTTLRRFKENVREVGTNYECGIGVENITDIKEGDILVAYQKKIVSK